MYKRNCGRFNNDRCPANPKVNCKLYPHCMIANKNPIPYGNSVEDYSND